MAVSMAATAIPASRIDAVLPPAPGTAPPRPGRPGAGPEQVGQRHRAQSARERRRRQQARAAPGHDHDGRAQAAARRDAEQVRVGQRVTEHP